MNKSPTHVLGELLVCLREMHRLTQEQYAAEIGRSQSWVSRIESGNIQLDIPTVTEIARPYNIPASKLLKAAYELQETFEKTNPPDVLQQAILYQSAASIIDGKTA